VEHSFPNRVGVELDGLAEKLRPLRPAYRMMGHTDMDMGKMVKEMPVPKNTIAMKGLPAPLAIPISMDAMVTVIKFRDRLKGYDEVSGWNQTSHQDARYESERRGYAARRYRQHRLEHSWRRGPGHVVRCTKLAYVIGLARREMTGKERHVWIV